MSDRSQDHTSPPPRPVGRPAHRAFAVLLAALVGWMVVAGGAEAAEARKRPCYIPESLDDPGCPINWPKGGGKSTSPGSGTTPGATRPGDPVATTKKGDAAAPSAATGAGGGTDTTRRDAPPAGGGEPSAGSTSDTSGPSSPGPATTRTEAATTGGDTTAPKPEVDVDRSGPSFGTTWKTVDQSGRKRGKTSASIDSTLASIGLSTETVGKTTFTPIADGTATTRTDVSTKSVKIDLLDATLATSGRFADSKSGPLTQIKRILSLDPKKVQGSVDIVDVEGERGYVAETWEYRKGPVTTTASLGELGSSGHASVGLDEKGRPNVAVGGEMHATAASGKISYTKPFKVAGIDMKGKVDLGAKALDGKVAGDLEVSSKKIGASVEGHVDLVSVSARPTMEVFGYEVGFDAMLGLGVAFEASFEFGKGKKTKTDADADFGVRKGFDFVFRRADDDEPKKAETRGTALP